MIKVWHEGMTDAESKDLAYWERNVLALRYADGWYNDDVEADCPEHHRREPDTNACPTCEREGSFRPRYEGWRRVLSLESGGITFHIPDDFDVGIIPVIAPNWDGHTTEEKWQRILDECGVMR